MNDTQLLLDRVSDQDLRGIAEFRHIVGGGRSLPPSAKNCILKGHLCLLLSYIFRRLRIASLHMAFQRILQDRELFPTMCLMAKFGKIEISFTYLHFGMII